MWLALLFSAFGAPSCPSVGVVQAATPYDAERVWIHEPGWFTPLRDPKTVALADETYKPDEPMLTLSVGGSTRAYPVRAMAYHHVANDVVGDEPVVVTY